jgi:CxxC motif-containing protein (DUF1111 family)
MKASLSLPLRLSTPILVLSLALLVAAPLMTAQSTNTGAVDPGPRNPGTVPAVADCPVPNPVKFPPPSPSTPNCVDQSQPASQPPNPPAAGAGNVVGFTDPLTGMWFESINVFEAVASVQGSSVVPTEPVVGLGPAFNSNSCFSCHSAPTVGGSSPGSVDINGTIFNIPDNFDGNPELQAMVDQGNTFNQNPSFPSPFSGPGFPDVLVDGPVIEVRIVNGGGSGGFVVQPGGVAELFTIESRTDAPGCTLAQFPFSSLGARSVSFRIPTPTFGLGFVEATPDAALQANSPPGGATTLGVVTGNFNRSGNDGTITRFGWKAQNKSLAIFAGEASNVEMGVTNELFPNEKTVASGSTCPTNISPAGNQPEDEILPATFPAGTGAANIASIISSNVENDAVFMRLNAAPAQCDRFLSTVNNGVPTCAPFGVLNGKTVGSPSVVAGQTIFNSAKLGCTQCHSPTLVTGPSQNPDLSNQTFHPYSDFALHNMGANLADGITQGSATSPFFRTAPLWGIGQRLFFLHDGRASDLATAIAQHCPNPSATNGGEACGSIAVFNSLTQAQQQDVLDFLRSL